MNLWEVDFCLFNVWKPCSKQRSHHQCPGGEVICFFFFFKSITENQAKENLNYLFLKIKERHLAVGAARREVQEELVTHLVRGKIVRGKIVREKLWEENWERKIFERTNWEEKLKLIVFFRGGREILDQFGCQISWKMNFTENCKFHI